MVQDFFYVLLNGSFLFLSLVLCIIRLVLMGKESCLRSIQQKIKGSLEGVVPVEVVDVDMEDEREGAFDEAVDKACHILGNLDAFVHCYTYEGTQSVPYIYLENSIAVYNLE